MTFITSLPIYTISSFGHNGIDWLHSLLDGHSKILIMPAFSFFRTLKLCKLKKNFSDEKMVKLLLNTLKNDKSYQVRRRKFLFDQNQTAMFEKNLTEYMMSSNEKNKFKKLFYGIHYSYAKIYNIDIKNIKAIVVQEHVPFFNEEYIKLFNSRIIIMMRDPRAAISGSIRAMTRVQDDNELNAHDFNFIILIWLYSRKCTKEIKKLKKNSIYFMKNEEMHQDLKSEMTELLSWMNLSFENINLKETILKETWHGESAYLEVNNENDLVDQVPSNYYNIVEVEKRWRKYLSKNLINMVEKICFQEMKKFNYKFDFSFNIINYCKAYFFYFTIFQKIDLKKTPLYWRILQIIKEKIVRILIIINPRLTINIFKRK